MDAEPHVDDLLDQLRHISLSGTEAFAQQTSHHEWSPSKNHALSFHSSETLGSRSPPAAAYLSSSVTAQDVLSFSIASPNMTQNLNASVGEPPGRNSSSSHNSTNNAFKVFSDDNPSANGDGFSPSFSSMCDLTDSMLASITSPKETANIQSPESNNLKYKFEPSSEANSFSKGEDLNHDSSSTPLLPNDLSDFSSPSTGSPKINSSKPASISGSPLNTSNDSSSTKENNQASTIDETDEPSNLSPSKNTVRRSLATALSFGRISLNPNAAEFVPTIGKGNEMTENSEAESNIKNPTSSYHSSKSAPVLSELTAMTGIPRSDSTNSNASDDEYRRYWRDQLPDELLSFEDVSLGIYPSDEAFDFDESTSGMRQNFEQGGFIGNNQAHPNSRTNRALVGNRGSGSPRIHISIPGNMSPSPSAMSGAWMVGPNGPNSQVPPVNIVGPNHSSPLHGPHPGLASVNGNGGFGYGPRTQPSPHPSPPRSNIANYSPPGHGRFVPPPHHPHLRDGINSPSGFVRGFPPPEPRPGMPPPFELPPTAGMRDRIHPPPPPWAGDGFDSMGDMHLEGPFPEDVAFRDPLSILVTEFPGFSAESIAEIFFANGGDMPLTMDTLTQLEIQEEGVRSSRFPPPSLSPMDFPALSGVEMVNGIPPHHHGGIDSQMMNVRRMEDGDRQLQGRPGIPGNDRIAPDFATIVRKQPHWPYDRNGVMEMGSGRGRGGPQAVGMHSFNPDARGAIGERSDMFPHVRDIHRPPTPWLEPGEAVANLYADMREEARDHARVRNIYFEQATQAFLSGNKGLAKELSLKGQWHNDQMKAAHAKAGEAIFRQRNPSPGYAHGIGNVGGGGQRVLDLHGLHVSEAVQILKRELSALRTSMRNTRQRQPLFVCVGVGHSKTRSSARISSAVERYLTEEEHLHYVETQPGMLRVFL